MNAIGPETIRLVKEWMEKGLASIQPNCYNLLIQDEWENKQEKENAQLDAIACIGIEKILEVVKVTESCFEQHKKDMAPTEAKEAFIQLVK